MLSCGQGVLLSLALFGSFRKNNYSNLFTGIFVSVLTIEIATYCSMKSGYFADAKAFHYYALGSYLFIPPALYLIIKTNLHPSFCPTYRHSLFFIPAFIDVVVNLTSQYVAEKLGNKYLLYNYTPWYFYSEILPMIGTFLVTVYFGVTIRKWSNTRFDHRDLSPSVKRIYALFIFSSAITTLWLSTTLVPVYHYDLIQICMIAFLISFGYMGFIYPKFFYIPDLLMPQTSGNSLWQLKDLIELERLRTAFEVNKIYRTPRLSVKMLAQHLNLPERYVSRLINQHYNESFNSYVNRYRVNDIIERLQCCEDSHKTLIAIAEESGFSSKSSFNSVFKEVTGKNPSEYLRK